MPVTTHTWMSAPTCGSVAQYNTWAGGISAALSACGLVQTSDTGQTNFATVGSLPSSGSYYYQIWRFNDALQATAPVFVRVECGNSSGKPIMRISAASGTDGAGVLTGNIYVTAQDIGSTSVFANTSQFACYASGDGSSINIVQWASLLASGTLYLPTGFSLARSCGTDGTYSADAVAFVNHGSAHGWQVTGISGTDNSIKSASGVYLPVGLPYRVNGTVTSLSSTLSEDGTTAPVVPVPHYAPGVAPWVANNLAVVHPGDAGSTSVIQVATINGSARTFRAFPYVMTTTASQASGAVSMIGTSSSVSAVCLPAIAWAV